MELLTKEIILSIAVIVLSSSGICRAVDCGGPEISTTIVVDKSNTPPNFASIQAAIDSIPTSNSKWVKIQINAGTYKEMVNIPVDKPCIFIQGQGADVTTITYDDHSAVNTSATFSAFSNNVVASDITFLNSYGLETLENLIIHNISYGIRTPSVAARISGDKCAFYNCNFIGFQDTVWDELGRHYFKNCMIEGAVDFIFGDGQSYYQDCVLNATALGCITAQARNVSSDPSGFVFEGGSVIGSSNGDSLLGRGYRYCSRVIFYKMDLGSVVRPVGWDAWNAKDNVTCLFYSEIGCTGAGFSTSQRVPWEKNLTDTDFNNNFSLSVFINQDGWLTQLPQKK
ncbi:putative pectinesterase 52 [Vigna unguiculata]|uniref:putative pectinesterase 52 n=1 Tax=Vigna unguiculata TaxID=3917 RepID=UPI001015EABD|nr:putative pectinesterase 52 [Vigna unguiculata]